MKRLLTIWCVLGLAFGGLLPSGARAAYAPLPIVAEDTAHVNAETLMRMGCRRIDAAASSAVASTNWSTFNCDATGRTWVNTELPDAITPAATGMAVPASSPWVLSALACYNTTTTLMDLCIGTNNVAHDGAGAAVNPMLIGGYANAAAPADVSADVDAVRAWFLRNGAQAMVLTAAGALIPGDATNGLFVNVKQVPTDPFGAVNLARRAAAEITAPQRRRYSFGSTGARPSRNHCPPRCRSAPGWKLPRES